VAASANNLLRKSKSRFATTLSSSISDSDTTIPLGSTTGLPTDTGITLTIDRTGSVEAVTGTVSGNNIINAKRGESSSTAAAHASGAVVEALWEADMLNDVVTHLLLGHDQAGSHIGTDLYAADAGANDTYVVTLSPVPVAYTTGMTVRFKANTINTGAATLNVNGLGAKTIVKGNSATLADGDIAAGSVVQVIYDGTNFRLIGGQAITQNAAMTTTARARAHNTSAQTISTASSTQLTLGTEDYDSGNNFASSAFTAPVTGFYAVSAGVQMQSMADGKNVNLQIKKNGSGIVDATFSSGAAVDVNAVVSDILQLAATDILTVFVIHNHGSDRSTTTTTTFMAVHLLSI